MGRKRFYDAVRDLIRDVQDEPVRRRPRLDIPSLLAAPTRCAACWEAVPAHVHAQFSCNACLGAFCAQCLREYCRAALADRSILPLRCADPECRAPVPLSSAAALLPADDVAKLARFQQELFRPVMPPDPALAAAEPPPESVPANEPEAAGTALVDTRLMSLMQRMGWQQCPDCGTGVERTQGCPHIVCVCGGEFCYQCGDRWRAGFGCSRRCGMTTLPETGVMQLLPGAFDAMRDEVWQRIVDLLAQLRQHLESQDRARTARRVPAVYWADAHRLEPVSPTQDHSVPAGKMSLGSIVHPDHY